jgi:uncharacterized lipoprotein YddW (UPF0748 family)
MSSRSAVAVLSCAVLSLLSFSIAAASDFRAAWVASVYNLNFPSRPGLPAAEQERQIASIVETAKRAGLNALMVQVRPEGDALYRSELEPWSRFLAGVQGESPGYDPLAVFLEEGSRFGVSIHAWINPYRAASNSGQPRASTHEAYTLSGAIRRVGSSLWLDPGDPAVRHHVTAVVKDLLDRYAVAGVVLDDYFYPYPTRGNPRGYFPDGTTYSRYRSEGGTLSLDDWRRHNVDQLISELHETVKSVRPHALFGVSPFGIYTRGGAPASVQVELDQYRDLYADPVKWIRQGWVDYLSPQLYWRDAGSQSYSALLAWWRSSAVNPEGVPIYPSITLDKLSSWPSSEIAHQLSLERTIKPRADGGFIIWNIGPVMANRKGIAGVIERGAGSPVAEAR